MNRSNSRVLIVGTVPYNEKSTSRAFDSYFHFWEKDQLAQIFSNTKTPCKGHCSTLYQITDHRMLKRWFNKNIVTGKVWNYDELPEYWINSDLEVSNNIINKLYNIGSKKNSMIYLLRKIIWKKKYWCTKELNNWLEKFNPECVFLAFSDDYFISEIALYVAEKFDIPIVSSIGDDYYFNYNRTISPCYHLYKLTYRKLIRKVFRHKGSAIYIGNKIKDKYNSYFGIKGETVYLTSNIERKAFKKIDVDNPKISYFGNIRLGRNESLNDIGVVLGKINSNYILNIYSNETDSRVYGIFKNNPNVIFHGSIPYKEVQKKNRESDIVVVVEGFEKKDVDITRYSLSTKVADSLASGANILAYGSKECGAISYAESTDCIAVSDGRENLEDIIRKLIFDEEYQKRNYDAAVNITEKNHKLEKSTRIFSDVINRVVERREKTC